MMRSLLLEELVRPLQMLAVEQAVREAGLVGGGVVAISEQPPLHPELPEHLPRSLGPDVLARDHLALDGSDVRSGAQQVTFRSDRVRWPRKASRARTQGAALAVCKGKPEDAEMRCASRVIQVCLVGEAGISSLPPDSEPRRCGWFAC